MNLPYIIILFLPYISYIPTENITNFILHGLKLSFFIPTLCYIYFLLFLYASVLLLAIISRQKKCLLHDQQFYLSPAVRFFFLALLFLM